MTEQSVWTEFLTARQARDVARIIKAAGYTTATIKLCRGYVINVARYFEPGDTEARAKLLDLICKAAKIQPRKESA
mgnify:CR=1 FL=1